MTLEKQNSSIDCYFKCKYVLGTVIPRNRLAGLSFTKVAVVTWFACQPAVFNLLP